MVETGRTSWRPCLGPGAQTWRSDRMLELPFSRRCSRLGTLALAFALAAVLAAAPVLAQEQTGDVVGTVRDAQGQPLPGVTVTISGIGAPSVEVTNAQGAFRVLNLSPGGYALTAEL